MEKIEKVLKVLGHSVAIIIPIILLSGYSYYLGYILTFDLSPDLIAKSMPDVLVESWYVGLLALGWLLTKLGYFFAIIFFSYCMVIASFFWYRHLKEKGVTWPFEEITRDNQGETFLTITQWQWLCLWEVSRDIFLIFLYPASALLILGAVTIEPFRDGRESAHKQVKLLSKHGCESSDKFNCTFLIDNTNKGIILAKGILVSANDKSIAIYNEKLEVWPLKDGYILRKNKKIKLPETE